jgi:hypothetical protein
VAALAQDNASFCGTVSSWGGAGAVAITPLAVPSGGGGYVGMTFCRTNLANSIISYDENGSMRLIHGWKSGDTAPEIKPQVLPRRESHTATKP